MNYMSKREANLRSGEAQSSQYEVKDLASDERFFRRRGLPTFIEDYSATEDILTRAWPWLLTFFFIQVGRSLWTSWEPLVATAILAGALSAIALTAALINVHKGKRYYAPPERIGWWSALVFIFVPSLMRINSTAGYIPAIKHIGFNSLIVVGVMGTIGWGLVQTIVWALVRVLGDLGFQLIIVFRQMAAIFLFSFLLFFNQEIWQFVDTAGEARFEALSLVLIFLCCAVIASGSPRLTRQLIGDLATASFPVRPLQKANITILLAVRQLGQILVISVATSAFFAILSALLISPGLLNAWKISNIALAEIHIWDTTFALTETGIYVSGFLGLLAGLNFAAVSMTSKEGREHFMEGLEEEFSSVFQRREKYIHAREELRTSGHRV